MKIGIYKIGKTIYFYRNKEDYANWSTEMTQVIRLFKDRGHEIFILSETDYDQDKYTVIRQGETVPKLDRIYVGNGRDDAGRWEQIFRHCDDVRLMLTDMGLQPTKPHLFTHIYSQSKMVFEYGALELAAIYNGHFATSKGRKHEFYFGGTERNRTKDFLEYVYRPGHLWYGRSHSLRIENVISFHDHITLLQDTKYTVVIGDEVYNTHQFVTMRFYENLVNGVLPFVDRKFDQGKLIPIHPELFVENFIDMRNKIARIEAIPGLREQLWKETVDLIPKPYINGDELYSRII